MIDLKYKALWKIMEKQGYLGLKDYRTQYPKGNLQTLVSNMQNAGYLMYDDVTRIDKLGREVPLQLAVKGTMKITIVRPMEGIDHERRINEIEAEESKVSSSERAEEGADWE